MGHDRRLAGAGLSRWGPMVLGVWLCISAFGWPHFEIVRTNTWVVGVLMFAAAVWGFVTPWARLVNTLLAIWLLITTPFEHHLSAATVWNNVIVGMLVLLVSRPPSHHGANDAGAIA